MALVTESKRYCQIVIIVFTALITYLHFSLFQEHFPHVIVEELYYLPLFLGALRFGLKGAVLTYLFVSAFYLPFLWESWTISFLDFAARVLHLLFSGLFTVLAGFLVEQERRYQRQSEKDQYLAEIGQAAAAIIHDLRNPLIVILGFARRIQEGKVNINTSAQVIMDSARSMERIVNDVLDFARPVRLELKEEDARAVITRACDSCKTTRTKAEEKEVPLSLDLPADPVPFVMDTIQMQRALVNLINNAIEASDTGREVLLAATRGKKGLAIRIKDHGAGMDKEALEKIFTPFFTTKQGGTGLGMAISKKIIEAHKGKIRIKSAPGTGTEVVIELSETTTG